MYGEHMKFKTKILSASIVALLLGVCASSTVVTASQGKAVRTSEQSNISVEELSEQAIILMLQGNSVEAITKFKLAADQGHAGSMVQLGFVHELGKGVPVNFTEAAKWYRKASDQNDATAQNQLGGLFESGSGVPKYPQNAFDLYSKSAKQNNYFAQFNVARLYFSGIGTLKNFKRGYEEVRKSAQQGYAPAQDLLSIAYELGLGTEKNLIEAYAWASLYSLQKGDTTVRDRIEAQLSTPAIQMGQEKANNYFNKKFE